MVLRAGVIGTGVMGSGHSHDYTLIADVELAGVASLKKEEAEALAKRFGTKAYPDADSLLADTSIDLVSICTHTPTHKELFLKAVAAGKHVICEKPLARTLEEADEIMAAAASGSKVYTVGHALRFFDEYVAIRRLIEEGAIGDAAVVRTTRGGGAPTGFNGWYLDVRQSGGVTVDLVIHDFDFLRWTFGPVERVFAKGTVGGGAGVDGAYALVTLRFRGGVIAHVEGTWMYPGSFYQALEACGSKGSVVFDSRSAAPLRVWRRQTTVSHATVEVPESPLRESPYTRQLRHFVRAAQGKEKLAVTVQDAYEALRISLAACESMQTGKAVTLS